MEPAANLEREIVQHGGVSALHASKAMPSDPTFPGFGGTIISAPVHCATAAASASKANGIPWQKIT